MRSTGFIVAAGGLAAVNELLFSSTTTATLSATPGGQIAEAGLAAGAPATISPSFSNFNWRIIPATVVLALLMGGLESLAPDFAVGLSGLVLLSTLIVPTGQAGSLIDNVTNLFPKG